MCESFSFLNGLVSLNIGPRLHLGHFIVNTLQSELGVGLLLMPAKVVKRRLGVQHKPIIYLYFNLKNNITKLMPNTMLLV